MGPHLENTESPLTSLRFSVLGVNLTTVLKISQFDDYIAERGLDDKILV